MDIKKIIPQGLKNYYHLTQAVFANIIYGFPSRKIKIIGVTGTNGKTTTCQMIAKVLEESGAKVAMASTINFKLGEKEWVNKTKFTTLSSFSVQKFIKKAVKSKCKYLVLETSSHSLDQYRVWGIKYNTAVITNVTREHLDYHEDMDSYRLAKLKLFENVENAIVNLDMEMPQDYLDCESKFKFGFTTREQEPIISDQEIRIIKAEGIKLEINGSQFTVNGSQFAVNLPGLFNVENALAAVCAGISQGIKLETIKNALEKIKGVPGRMEYVSNEKGMNIIIDYALTPDSLSKLYELIERINTKKAKIIAVFGSCGDRDRGKRPIMGEIVGKSADYVIVTNEDPYGEDPQHIINEVFAGVLAVNGNKNCEKHKEENINCWRIFDRREAIKKALAMAEPSDFVIVTGKGAEETMMIGAKMIPWNDKKVILEELQKI